MLSERARYVLNILIDQYARTAVPVASEDIARLSATKVSSATVRSTMSQLTEEGYISRPHRSASGIPSDFGYRYYLETLTDLPDLPEPIRRHHLRHWPHPYGLPLGSERGQVHVLHHEPVGARPSRQTSSGMSAASQ